MTPVASLTPVAPDLAVAAAETAAAPGFAGLIAALATPAPETSPATIGPPVLGPVLADDDSETDAILPTPDTDDAAEPGDPAPENVLALLVAPMPLPAPVAPRPQPFDDRLPSSELTPIVLSRPVTAAGEPAPDLPLSSLAPPRAPGSKRAPIAATVPLSEARPEAQRTAPPLSAAAPLAMVERAITAAAPPTAATDPGVPPPIEGPAPQPAAAAAQALPPAVSAIAAGPAVSVAAAAMPVLPSPVAAARPPAPANRPRLPGSATPEPSPVRSEINTDAPRPPAQAFEVATGVSAALSVPAAPHAAPQAAPPAAAAASNDMPAPRRDLALDPSLPPPTLVPNAAAGGFSVATDRLGPVQVLLEARDARVSVQLAADTPAAGQLLAAQPSRLADAVAAGGQRLDALAVDVRSGGGGQPQRQAPEPRPAPPLRSPAPATRTARADRFA